MTQGMCSTYSTTALIRVRSYLVITRTTNRSPTMTMAAARAE